jgi:hypothetical protein
MLQQPQQKGLKQQQQQQQEEEGRLLQHRSMAAGCCRRWHSCTAFTSKNIRPYPLQQQQKHLGPLL